jgi:hypothetical protein
VDGEVVKNRLDAVKVVKVKDAISNLRSQYAVEIRDDLPISVQCWKIVSVEQGQAGELLKKAYSGFIRHR